MINAISASAPAQPVAQSSGSEAQKPSKPAPQPVAADSVQLSNATQIRLAALQETTETAAQTAKEAVHGDHQAQRLLAKEAAKTAK
jgi:hypothetical protein